MELNHSNLNTSNPAEKTKLGGASGLTTEARHLLEEQARAMKERLAVISVQPLPRAGSTEIRYQPEGERLASAVCRLTARRGATTEAEVTATVQEVDRTKGSILAEAPPTTPLELAQDMMYQAQLANGRKRVKLARRALQLSPDCANAYLLLAEEDGADDIEARSLIEQALAAVERAVRETLGDEIWNGKREFWRVLPCRPYLRALGALASCLWRMGENESAIARFQEALILDSEDHQNLRHQLAVCLLVLNRDDDVEPLLEQFNNDDGIQWSYTRALWQFRRTGASRESNTALDDAFNSNRILPLYLVGLQQVPRRAPQDIGAGSAIEARDYLIANIGLWLQTQGALIWLAERLVKRLHDLETASLDFTKSLVSSTPTSEFPPYSLIGTRPGT